MAKKILIALAPGMLEQVDKIAQYEHRSRSDLLREMARRYIFAFNEHTPLSSIRLQQELTFKPGQFGNPNRNADGTYAPLAQDEAPSLEALDEALTEVACGRPTVPLLTS